MNRYWEISERSLRILGGSFLLRVGNKNVELVLPQAPKGGGEEWKAAVLEDELGSELHGLRAGSALGDENEGLAERVDASTHGNG
jgi:hypothetical protein